MTRRIEGFEELTDAVHGAQIDVLQLERGRLRGHLTHIIVDGMPLSVGAFSIGVRTRGVLSDDAIERLSRRIAAIDCLTPRGGILAMRPLIVHASSKSRSATPRRVLHIEYTGSVALYDGLELAIS